MTVRVQKNLIKGQHLSGVKAGAAAQLNGDPCEEFLHLKRLGEIIDGAAEQKIDLIFCIYFGADDDDRNLLDFCQNLFSGTARKHQVEQNQVRLSLFK